MLERKQKQQYLKALTKTFEAFSYTCSVPKGVGCTWEMVAKNFSGEKEYAMVFAPRVDGHRNNIRIAQKKVAEGTRIVVVTEEEIKAEEIAKSEEDGYTLVTLDIMERYGVEMLETLEREKSEGKEMTEEELSSLISTREKIF
jgi:hypothetical protein